MLIERTAIPDVLKISPKRFVDNRGYFCEVFKDGWFRQNVANVSFVQDNESLSAGQWTTRGLHFQSPPVSQAKLVRVLSGAIFDVAVDIRRDSPTYGKWVGVELDAQKGEQLWIPVGFAHGFMTLRPDTVVHYKVTAAYSAEHDHGVLWNDPDIGIAWPEFEGITLSAKDQLQPKLSQLPHFF